MKTAVFLSGPIGVGKTTLGQALAEAFSFEIASPVAAQDFRFKSAAFVFRTTGCPEPAKAEITATGEGLAGGELHGAFETIQQPVEKVERDAARTASRLQEQKRHRRGDKGQRY